MNTETTKQTQNEEEIIELHLSQDFIDYSQVLKIIEPIEKRLSSGLNFKDLGSAIESLFSADSKLQSNIRKAGPLAQASHIIEGLMMIEIIESIEKTGVKNNLSESEHFKTWIDQINPYVSEEFIANFTKSIVETDKEYEAKKEEKKELYRIMEDTELVHHGKFYRVDGVKCASITGGTVLDLKEFNEIRRGL